MQDTILGLKTIPGSQGGKDVEGLELKPIWIWERDLKKTEAIQ